jgi:hypothetical protein
VIAVEFVGWSRDRELPGSVVCMPAPVTATVKVNVAAVVGVPDSPAGGLAVSARRGRSVSREVEHV